MTKNTFCNSIRPHVREHTLSMKAILEPPFTQTNIITWIKSMLPKVISNGKNLPLDCGHTLSRPRRVYEMQGLRVKCDIFYSMFYPASVCLAPTWDSISFLLLSCQYSIFVHQHKTRPTWTFTNELQLSNRWWMPNSLRKDLKRAPLTLVPGFS